MNRGAWAWVCLLFGAAAATVLIGAGLRLLAFNALGAGPAWSQQPVPDLGCRPFRSSDSVSCSC